MEALIHRFGLGLRIRVRAQVAEVTGVHSWWPDWIPNMRFLKHHIGTLVCLHVNVVGVNLQLVGVLEGI